MSAVYTHFLDMFANTGSKSYVNKLKLSVAIRIAYSYRILRKKVDTLV